MSSTPPQVELSLPQLPNAYSHYASTLPLHLKGWSRVFFTPPLQAKLTHWEHTHHRHDITIMTSSLHTFPSSIVLGWPASKPQPSMLSYTFIEPCLLPSPRCNLWYPWCTLDKLLPLPHGGRQLLWIPDSNFTPIQTMMCGASINGNQQPKLTTNNNNNINLVYKPSA